MVQIQKLNQNLFRPFFSSLEKFQMRYNEDVDGLLLMRDWLADHASEQLLTEFNAEFGEEIMMVENPPSFKWYEYLYWGISEFNLFVISSFFLALLIFISMAIGANLSKIYQEMPTDAQNFALAVQLAAILTAVLASMSSLEANPWTAFKRWLHNLWWMVLVFMGTIIFIAPPPHPAEKVVLAQMDSVAVSAGAAFLLIILSVTVLLRLGQLAWEKWGQGETSPQPSPK
jgi:hypothetical protein